MMPVKIIFVCVNKALDGKMLHDINPKTTPLIDVARGCWVIDLHKANLCDWLVAVYHSVVVGVYEINKKFGWKVAVSGCISTRHISVSNQTRYYCQLTDISQTKGKAYMNQRKRMYGAAQYS